LDGHGHVDLALERNGLRVACEISVSTSPSHELDNLSKCLAAGFDYAVLVSIQEATLRNARRRFAEEFPEELAGRVLFLSPEDFIQWLDEARGEAFARGRQSESSTDPAKPDSKATKTKPKTQTEPPPGEEGLFNALQAAAYIRRAPQTLAKLRVVGGGPPFYKLGRSVFYKREDLDQWLDARRRRSTSDDGDATD
jgi:hypothetical protein